MSTHSAFFYGTLMHPKVLTRVIKNTGSHLHIAPAVLLDHTRHVVLNADYPGVAPVSRSKELFDSERVLTREESCVRGTLVSGLTKMDMKLLDFFEGAQYIRERVDVHPLAEKIALSAAVTDKDLIPANPAPITEQTTLPASVNAQTYIIRDIHNLSPELWSYEDFVHRTAWKYEAGGIGTSFFDTSRLESSDTAPVLTGADALAFRYDE